MGSKCKEAFDKIKQDNESEDFSYDDNEELLFEEQGMDFDIQDIQGSLNWADL